MKNATNNAGAWIEIEADKKGFIAWICLPGGVRNGFGAGRFVDQAIDRARHAAGAELVVLGNI